jgi:hypothetical protein
MMVTHMHSTQQNCVTTKPVSGKTLLAENRLYAGTGGRSQENRSAAFRPAFWDTSTQTVYLSRFGDGSVAPIHVLDGLPAELVLERSAQGHALVVRAGVISGFERLGRFYTRDEATAYMRRFASNSDH